MQPLSGGILLLHRYLHTGDRERRDLLNRDDFGENITLLADGLAALDRSMLAPSFLFTRICTLSKYLCICALSCSLCRPDCAFSSHCTALSTV